jgi:hypothetical protein
MKTLMVDYDLNTPGQKYDNLIAYLKSYSAWAKPLKSTFLIRTSKTTVTVRDEILRIIDFNDAVLVTDVTGEEMAWNGLSSEVSNWIKNNNGTFAYR